MSRAMPYLKAIYGSLLTALSAAATEYVATGTITLAGGITIAISFVTSLGVIWGVPNLPKLRPGATTISLDQLQMTALAAEIAKELK